MSFNVTVDPKEVTEEKKTNVTEKVATEQEAAVVQATGGEHETGAAAGVVEEHKNDTTKTSNHTSVKFKFEDVPLEKRYTVFIFMKGNVFSDQKMIYLHLTPNKLA